MKLNYYTGKLFVVVGRFQPLHIEHENLFEKIISDMENNDRLLVIVGSSNKVMSMKNPYHVGKRKAWLDIFLKKAFSLDLIQDKPYDIADMKDFDYMDDMWEDELHKIVSGYSNKREVIFCSSKKEGDDELRASWARGCETRGYETDSDLSATDIRNILCSGNDFNILKNYLNTSLSDVLNSGHVTGFLRNTYEFAENYKRSFSSTPFPVQYAATDIVLRDREGNYLFIVRGGDIGEGATALVGGFLEEGLTSWENTKKELLEEANINLNVVPHNIITSWYCSELGRSVRGRMTTEVFLVEIDYSFKNMSYIKAGDDAKDVLTFTEEEVHNISLFSDHYGLFLKVLDREKKGIYYS